MASNLLAKFRLLSIRSFVRTREKMIQRRRIIPARFDHLLNGFGISSMPKYDETSKEPIIPSLSVSMAEGKYYKSNFPGLEKTESDEALCVFLHMPGVKTQDDVEALVTHGTDTNLLVIKGETNEGATLTYFGFIKFPENVDISHPLKAEMKSDGMFKLTLPKIKGKEFANLIANFRFKLLIRYYACVTSVLRPCIQRYFLKEFCPDPFNSLTMYKEATAERLYISITRESDKMELTREGAWVSLNMPELKIEDVKSYIGYDVLFIEGKTKTKTKKVHYVTGIRLPESFFKKRNTIKTEMQDGMCKVTLEIIP